MKEQSQPVECATLLQAIIHQAVDTRERLSRIVILQNELIERVFGPRPTSSTADQPPQMPGLNGELEAALKEINVLLNAAIDNQLTIKRIG